MGGRRLHLHKHRLLIPSGASELKDVLLRKALDANGHCTGADRAALPADESYDVPERYGCLVKVNWIGMDADVSKYVASWVCCQFVKTDCCEAAAGTLKPTNAPHVNHTWCADLKGPMPFDTGYVLVAVEAITWFTRLRYMPKTTAKEVSEEGDEYFVSSGTRPVMPRSDGGTPFDWMEYMEFIAGEGITPVLGLPCH